MILKKWGKLQNKKVLKRKGKFMNEKSHKKLFNNLIGRKDKVVGRQKPSAKEVLFDGNTFLQGIA